MDIQRTRSFLPLKELAEKVLTGVEGINTLDDSLLNGIISAGEVIKIDELVKTVKFGDFVSYENHIPCVQCYQCQTEKQHVCTKIKILDVHINCVFSEYALMKKVSVWINVPLILSVYASIKKLLGDALDNNKSR